MLRAILNKSWRQYPTRHQLYGHLPPITKTIQVRRTRHAGPCWRSRDELISDVLLWTPTHGRAKAGRPARTYIQQLCEDTGCCPEDLPRAMNDREEWRERVRDIRATSATWWWWWLKYVLGIRFTKIDSYWLYIFITPPSRLGCDTRLIFKEGLTGLNSEFSSSYTGSPRKVKEISVSYYLLITGRRITGFIPFPRVLVLCDMQTASSRIQNSGQLAHFLRR